MRELIDWLGKHQGLPVWGGLVLGIAAIVGNPVARAFRKLVAVVRANHPASTTICTLTLALGAGYLGNPGFQLVDTASVHGERENDATKNPPKLLARQLRPVTGTAEGRRAIAFNDTATIARLLRGHEG